MEYGLQLFSVRDVTETDLRGALERVAALGYRFVEFAGFFSHSGEEIAGWLRELGLRASGTHTQLEALRASFDGVVAEHRALGCDTLIVPYADGKTQAELIALADELEGYRVRLAAEGITLGYHNHAHEFKAMEGGPGLMETLVARTSLALEIDTYWVYAAGESPVEWMKRLRALNRLPVIHIKDGLADGTGKPLGLGTAPVRVVWETAKALGVPMVVESETLTPSGMDEARVCMEALRGFGE